MAGKKFNIKKYKELEKKYKKLEATLPYDKRIENVDISNDFMFCYIMQDKEIFAEVLSRILPDIQIGRVELCEYQKTMREYIDMQGVRFDVYAKTSLNGEMKIFDVEMQNANEDSLPKRARYYHSIMTSNIMNRAKIKNYKYLPCEFVIFICKFDLFKRGKYIYEFENLCIDDKDLSLGDDTHTIFVNAAGSIGEISPKLKNFLDFVLGKTSNDPFITKLEDRIVLAKQRPEWRMDYMKLLMRDSLNFEAGLAEGEKQGIVKGTLGEKFATAKRMLSLNFKLSEIMEATQLSLNDLNSLLQQA
ncbi:MAG: Rpn family recombination-promoting nuclease/putative transposase [Synergistaceae bacterium]|nr:Rpn family recombination-promoting nuclease/putative transposase [Synergistaceae bacterium]